MDTSRSASVPAVEMRGIVKRFQDVVANDRVDFTLLPGEIHALLGENGAGKTTLMRILYGLYHADQGEIWVRDQPATIRSPKDAIARGIGMVTQHFALVPPLTVAENVILGHTSGIRVDLAEARERVAAAAQRLRIPVDPGARVRDLSVGERQRVEILKALYRGAQVLILDEPTAVLVPQEVEALFASLRRLRDSGLSVVFISHKLHEVMALCDRVTVLRQGRVVGTVSVAETDRNTLARMMVGRLIQPVSRPAHPAGHRVLLRLDRLSARDDRGLLAVKEVSLAVRAGEILGLAGVSGNGQTELAQVLDGTRPAESGRVLVDGQEVPTGDPVALMAAGIGRIPEDRHESVVAELTVAENMVLEHLDEFVRNGTLDREAIHRHAARLIQQYQIRARPEDPIRTLSGGNMQKVILARVLERAPKVLVVAQPTRGLDVGATEYVRSKLVEQRERGAAILLISEDLDEILELSDRIAVIYEGHIVAILSGEEADPERLGLLMSGAALRAEARLPGRM